MHGSNYRTLDTVQGSPEVIEPLTSLRFFAAMAVVFYHAGSTFAANTEWIPDIVANALGNGYLGVTFFFVLSGFILHYIYREKIDRPGVKRRYAVARFARIYPVYLLSLAIIAPLLLTAEWNQIPQFFLLQMWIPDTIHQFKNINGPAWTLSVELFFYLIFPFLAPLARRCPTRTLIVLILIIGAFIMMSQSSAPGHNKGAPFDWMHYVPLPILRLPEFLLGIGLSEYFLRGGRWPRIPAWIFAAATIGVMAVSPSRAVSGFVTVFAGLLILAIAYDRNSRFYRFLSAKWLVVLGGASYAIYLLHVSLRHYLDMLVGETLSRFLQFPMVIIAGLFVFIAFEEPIRAWLKARLGGKNVERRLVLSPAP